MVGGGFLGFVLTTTQWFWRTGAPVPWLDYVPPAIVAVLYLYGILFGIALTEKREIGLPVFIYFVIQVPFVTSPRFAYHFISGFHITAWLAESGPSCIGGLGSDWLVDISQARPWGFGINVVAMAISIGVWKRIRSHRIERAINNSTA
jgi:hypothetical protein